MDKARRIQFTLSCLQEGVRRARLEAKARAMRDNQHAANLAARWNG